MRMMRWVVAGLMLGAGYVGAQTLATGDSRTVTEPVFPASCSVLAAQQAIVSGGPASETSFDTSRVQTALTACPSGQAVELTVAGTNNAFLIQPLTIPSGVGLIVDGGVTVFASRNPADYQTASTEQCGSYGASGNGCSPLLIFSSGTGSGLYGFGVIDARGGSTMLGGPNNGITWWKNADNANTVGQSQDNFVIMKPSNANSFALYKITLRNSPMFHVVWSGNGFTAWGVKIATPFPTHNTDGIDPSGTNVTVNQASISDGDDDFAINASSAGSNMTVENSTTYSGHGISIGSYTQGGFNNLLVNNVNMAGTPSDNNATGIRLKSAMDRGGLVQNITYENMCVRDIRYPLQLNPFYNSNAGTLTPTFQNIVLSNVHFLTPTTGQYPYMVQLQGHDATHLTTMTLQNVVFDSLAVNQVTPAPEYDTIALAGNVYPAFLQSLSGTGVTYTGSATAIAGAGVSACTNAFPYIVGELYESTATATNLKTASIAQTATLTLNAVVEPAMSQTSFSGTAGTWTGAAAPTAAVNFYEGTTLVGSGTLAGNGTLATATLNGLTAGAHTYTAAYPGDSNYPAITFGSVSVTVSASGIATTTSLTIAPTTIYAGGTVTLTATVTPATLGTVTFYNGSTAIGMGTVNGSGVASTSYTVPTSAAGAQQISASYSSGTNGTFASSTSAVQTLTVAAAVTMTSSASTINVTHGSSGTVTLSLAPGGGFTGTDAVTCSTVVAYVTCSVSPASATISSASAVNVTGTIAVAATLSKAERGAMGRGNGVLIALMWPAGLMALAFTRRKQMRVMWLAMLVLATATMLNGCGGASSSGGSGGGTAPSGTQVVTFTSTVAGVAQSVVVTVNIQ